MSTEANTKIQTPFHRREFSLPDNREAGGLMVETTITVLVLTIGLLQFMGSFQTNFRATRDIGVQDQGYAALDRVVEILRNANYATLYSAYHNASLEAPGLVAPGGTGTASVLVQFHVNETNIPSVYGPIADLDGDGAKTSTNVSTNYSLLPCHLTLSYQMSFGPETKHYYLVLGKH